jgi:hypothetical protein
LIIGCNSNEKYDRQHIFSRYLQKTHGINLGEHHDEVEYFLIVPNKGCMVCLEKTVNKYSELKKRHSNLYLITTSPNHFYSNIREKITSNPSILVDHKETIDRLNIGLGGASVIKVLNGEFDTLIGLNPTNIDTILANLYGN